MTTELTLADFIQSRGITLKYVQTDRNPNMDGSADMDNWRVFLHRGAQELDTYFSKGKGHKGAPPTLEEILDCLASDASGVENSSSFEDWAADYGYDPDSRSAERTYCLCKDGALFLEEFLGREDYETLLWNVERL